MSLSFDSGALLSRSYPLSRGPRVRLRLARPHDAPAIQALIERRGLHLEGLEIARLVRSDPRSRAVICATALVGATETVVGLGAIGLDADPRWAPDPLVVDEQVGEELEELLVRALRDRADALARSQAA